MGGAFSQLLQVVWVISGRLNLSENLMVGVRDPLEVKTWLQDTPFARSRRARRREATGRPRGDFVAWYHEGSIKIKDEYFAM